MKTGRVSPGGKVHLIDDTGHAACGAAYLKTVRRGHPRRVQEREQVTCERCKSRLAEFSAVETGVLELINSLEMMPDDYKAFVDRVDQAQTVKELRAIAADIARGCTYCAGRGKYVPAERYYGYFQGFETRGVFNGYLCDQCAESEDFLSLRKVES